MSDNPMITKYLNTIQNSLDSNEAPLIEAALNLMCYLNANGYNMQSFVPQILKYVFDSKHAISSMAQMLIIDITNGVLEEKCVCLLLKLIDSKNPKKRLFGLKTLANLNVQNTGYVIDVVVSRIEKEKNLLLRKVILLTLSCLAKKCSEKISSITTVIKRYMDGRNVMEVEGALEAIEILSLENLIEENYTKYSLILWNMLLKLSCKSQAIALKYLRRNGNWDHMYIGIIRLLMHSQDISVVIEASKFLMDEPEMILPPLIRLSCEQNVQTIFVYLQIEKISKSYPDVVLPYANHFLPPKDSDVFSHLSVLILTNIGASKFLLRWALYYNNKFAAHSLGKLKNEKALTILLKKGNEQISEIAAFYISKFIKSEDYIAKLLQFKEIRASIVSIFTDLYHDFPELSQEMLEILLNKFNNLSRDIKYEGSLLAASLINLNQSKIGYEFLQKCLVDTVDSISSNAKILQFMISSENPNIRNSIVGRREIPNPSIPTVYMPINI